MTDREFLKAKLLSELEPKLQVFGFKLNKNLAEFTRSNNDGWFKYQIVFLKIDNGWELKPSLLLRFNIIEDIFHKISGFEEKYKKGTPTIGISIEDYLENDKYRYQLIDKDQIDNLVQQLYVVFQKIAVPFFDRFNTIEKLDEVLNVAPGDTTLTGSIYKGLKALIIAKLVKRDNYKELEETYFNYYEKFSDSFYLPEYRSLVKLLEKY